MNRILSSVVLSVAFFAIGISAQPSMSLMTEPAMSPDGKEIVFVSGGDIWIVPAEGGTASLLVSHPAEENKPMFSPDGKTLAFQSNRTGLGDIYLLDIATNKLRRLTYNDGSDRFDSWSRDGEWIYFNSSSLDIWGMRDLFRVRATGGTPQQVSADRYVNEFHGALSPDGKKLAFAARGISNSQWWRLGRSHIDETELWLKEGDKYTKFSSRGAKQHWPMWSKDGKSIYFASDHNGIYQNIRVKPLGGVETKLTNFNSGRVLFPTISYDGKTILFERNFGIWKLDIASKRARPLSIKLRGSAPAPAPTMQNVSGGISEFDLSPDGKKFVIVSRGEVFAALSSESGNGVRVTNTAAPESFATWSSDSKSVVYVSERNGKHELFSYEFSSSKETQLTSGNEDYSPVFSGDGKYIAFIRNAREIWVYDTEEKSSRKVSGFYGDLPPLVGKRSFTWSPDDKWIAFLTLNPDTRSYTNASIVNVEDRKTERVSFIANSFSGTISWSPDGEYLLFDTQQRTESPSLARVTLKLRTPKFSEDKFRELFPAEENPKEKPKPSPSPSSSPAPKTEAKDTIQRGAVTPAKQGKDDKKKKDIEIDFADIRKRLDLLGTGVEFNEHVISPDGKTLVVTASAEGSFNLYAIDISELSRNRTPRQLTSSRSFKYDAQFSPDGNSVYYVSNGRINRVFLGNGRNRSISVNMRTMVDFEKEKHEMFEQGWRYMRDHFYDPGFHGKDWNAVYKTYKPLVAGAKNKPEVRRIMNMMVGELNASHLGVSGGSGFSSTPIGRLGIRFDRAEYESSGKLKITEIIDLSPAAVSKKIEVGNYVVSVDGVEIGANMNFDQMMMGKVGTRTEIGISETASGETKTVVIKPVSTGVEKFLLYRQWVESRREYVDRISGGKLGYVHLPNMGGGALNQLYVDLDAINQAKQGVVIDVRNNNGGFINPYVIDILSRRSYLTMQERGLWKYPARSALGQRSLERPTVLLTNQHSLSDSEDLAEGYRELKLGKIVGEKTSGWIIFTWSPSLFEGTRFRLPRSKITDNRGQNMELNPRPVDVKVTNAVGETLVNKDSQLDAAVETLLRGN